MADRQIGASETGQAVRPLPMPSLRTPSLPITPPSGSLRRAGADPKTPLELLRRLLLPQTVRWIETLARRQGTGVVATALAIGALSHGALIKALGRIMPVSAMPADFTIGRTLTMAEMTTALREGRIIAAGGSRLMMLTDDTVAALLARPPVGQPVLLASPAAFGAALRKAGERAWVDRAVNGLLRDTPSASAACPWRLRGFAIGLFAFTVLCCLALVQESPLSLATGLMLCSFFGLWSLVRLFTALTPEKARPLPALTDDALPSYGIVLALHRERAVIRQLVTALKRIDYPRAKLHIVAAVEADDPDTIAALAEHDRDGLIEIIAVPPCHPRTKPKALCAALPFVRGEMVVVYDAEDRPHPHQLREAAATFATGGVRLGCVQAPLMIAHARWSALTRLFAAEYAGLFRALLPALARAGWPLPLGGTSNHFRRAALSNSLGWDPFNVTEDADLGLRLARRGWRVGVITQPTLESCPLTLKAWLDQRSRWYKGWMQTLAVHLWQPHHLWREAGARGAGTIAVLILSSILSSLFYAPCLAIAGVQVAQGGWASLPPVAVGFGLFGLAAAMLAGAEGLRREGRLSLALALPLTPLYWLIQSLAAWMALIELGCKPFHWRKTMHEEC